MKVGINIIQLIFDFLLGENNIKIRNEMLRRIYDIVERNNNNDRRQEFIVRIYDLINIAGKKYFQKNNVLNTYFELAINDLLSGKIKLTKNREYILDYVMDNKAMVDYLTKEKIIVTEAGLGEEKIMVLCDTKTKRAILWKKKERKGVHELNVTMEDKEAAKKMTKGAFEAAKKKEKLKQKQDKGDNKFFTSS